MKAKLVLLVSQLLILVSIITVMSGYSSPSKSSIEQTAKEETPATTVYNVESKSHADVEAGFTKTTDAVVEATTQATKQKTTTTTTQPEIITQQETTQEKVIRFYDDNDLYILSHLISGEAGGESDACQIAVGSVVLNRVNSSRFPNTIKDVVYAPNQYACTWDGNFDRQPDARAIKNAQHLLENGSQIPSGVVFQAQFVQGKVWQVIDGEYFCYG